MKVVFDSNVLVSALIKSGKSRELLFRVVEKRIHLVLSRSILEEFLEVTENPKIRKYVDKNDVIAFLRVLGSIITVVKVKSAFEVVKEDPEDDIVLRTAYDGKVEYIVSGDKHLLSLKEFRRIKIVTINQMLDMISEK